MGLVALIATASARPGATPLSGWRSLRTGMELLELRPPVAADEGGRLRILRLSLDHLRLVLLNASALPDRRPRTMAAWLDEFHLLAALNASMFQEDHLTSVSLMQRPGHVNNPRLSRDRTVLAFDPKTPDLPPARLIDRDCDPFEELAGRYRTLVQSIRMISCRGRNVWSRQWRRWSVAALGVDGAGRVLFLHLEPPMEMRAFVDWVMSLGLDLERAMYLEGGLEAQLAYRAGDRVRVYGGRSVVLGLSAEGAAPPVPNVIGVVPRDRSLSGRAP